MIFFLMAELDRIRSGQIQEDTHGAGFLGDGRGVALEVSEYTKIDQLDQTGVYVHIINMQILCRCRSIKLSFVSYVSIPR